MRVTEKIKSIFRKIINLGGVIILKHEPNLTSRSRNPAILSNTDHHPVIMRMSAVIMIAQTPAYRV